MALEKKKIEEEKERKGCAVKDRKRMNIQKELAQAKAKTRTYETFSSFSLLSVFRINLIRMKKTNKKR